MNDSNVSRETLLRMKARVCNPVAADALRKRLEAIPNRIDRAAMESLCGPSGPFYGMHKLTVEE